MKKKGFSSEEIIRKFRQAEVLLHEGKVVAEMCRELGVTDSTYYKWRQGIWRLEDGSGERLKDLERENTRLKRVVADLTLDKLILQDAAHRESNEPRAQCAGGDRGDAALRRFRTPCVRAFGFHRTTLRRPPME